MLDHMFHLPLPLLEKILRPVIVYLVLIALLRIFGKRELAQLNPFDLVVLLAGRTSCSTASRLFMQRSGRCGLRSRQAE